MTNKPNPFLEFILIALFMVYLIVVQFAIGSMSLQSNLISVTNYFIFIALILIAVGMLVAVVTYYRKSVQWLFRFACALMIIGGLLTVRAGGVVILAAGLLMQKQRGKHFSLRRSLIAYLLVFGVAFLPELITYMRSENEIENNVIQEIYSSFPQSDIKNQITFQEFSHMYLILKECAQGKSKLALTMQGEEFANCFTSKTDSQYTNEEVELVGNAVREYLNNHVKK